MARRKKKEEHINHERWLVSYADFITLLFAFFTSLYAISTVDAKKAGKMVFSTRAAFNVDFFPTDKPTLGLSENTPPDMVNVRVPKEKVVPAVPQKKAAAGGRAPAGLKLKTLRSAMEEIRKVVEVERLKGVSVRTTRNNIVVSLRDAAFFDPSSTEIRKRSLPALDVIAKRLVDTRLDMRVEGHADDTPIAGKKTRSNWEMSTQRAISVVRYFIEEYAYPPDAMSVAGYGSYRPSDPNVTAPGRASNRRVDIVLTTPRRETADTQDPNALDTPLPGQVPPEVIKQEPVKGDLAPPGDLGKQAVDPKALPAGTP